MDEPESAERVPQPELARYEAAMIARAMAETELDVPVLHARVMGDRVKLLLYGGQTRTWWSPSARKAGGLSIPTGGPRPPVRPEPLSPAEVLARLPEGSLWAVPVVRLRQLAMFAGLFPDVHLAKVRKRRLVEAFEAYRREFAAPDAAAPDAGVPDAAAPQDGVPDAGVPEDDAWTP